MASGAATRPGAERDASCPSHADDVWRVVPQGVVPPEHLPPAVFAAAVEAFVAGERLDMQALARLLGMGRATLYRHAGNREQVLDEVLWWRSRRALVAALQAAEGLRGAARISAVIAGVLRAVGHDRPVRTFLEADPELAMRILTGTRSRVQQGMSRALGALVEIESERGNFATDLDTPTLAYAVVRIAEGFLYADVIADRKPDIERAVVVVDALLRGLDSADRASTRSSRT